MSSSYSSRAEKYDLISCKDLTWDLSRSHLTTQYKSFYMCFDDGSFGYLQIAYGNLGLLVKVTPLGWTYYPAKTEKNVEPIVNSSTYLYRSMKISKDRYSVDVQKHFMHFNSSTREWHIVIEGVYDLKIKTEDSGFSLVDFGQNDSSSRMEHKIFPINTVEGTVTAHGREKKLTGVAVYVGALFFREKFTNLGHTWQNSILFDKSKKSILTCLHYFPRDPSQPFRSQASLTLDGKLIAVLLDNEYSTKGAAQVDGIRYLLPEQIHRILSGQTFDGKPVRVELSAELEELDSITDVLKIFPKWAKDIVSIWAGLPFVFVWLQHITAEVFIDNEHVATLSGCYYLEQTCVHLPQTC
ncbi:ER to Golgi ceramide transport protein, lipocalin superfamily Svf2 [Schizosaccharomyces pombe]|uniref:Survival factor 2 n=1 Tax=Schizosaccharomyces pombe (strain 972 / ATCC 24843) TaxID=284812 RepID=SVF2_SCHPO|nr:Svf1 family protein Svf2 [Schizosaccharomyces pombe]Q9HGN8.1 RecName: Full=Survival factor 2 [Schizosaccharomyces pombe 972h-]CAC05723.1 Svf1 family protein Svf2 [Schizosaccharomyces pombe]|eukprot:NP_595984.1 Svf1 family protein Svf2 [Schizosaccharomyces pombe]